MQNLRDTHTHAHTRTHTHIHTHISTAAEKRHGDLHLAPERNPGVRRGWYADVSTYRAPIVHPHRVIKKMPPSNNNAEYETLFTVARWYRHAIYLRVSPSPNFPFPVCSTFRTLARGTLPPPPCTGLSVLVRPDRCFLSVTRRMPRVNRDWLDDELGPLRKFSRTFGGHHRATSCCPSALSRDPHQSLREFHPFPLFCPYTFIAEKPIMWLPPLCTFIC